MRIFVSYSRADNSHERLNYIYTLAAAIGDAYIDDLHHPSVGDREIAVNAALATADTFLAVQSPHYLQTTWTRYELSQAAARNLPLFALSETGRISNASYEELICRAEIGADYQTPASLATSFEVQGHV